MFSTMAGMGDERLSRRLKPLQSCGVGSNGTVLNVRARSLPIGSHYSRFGAHGSVL